MRVKLHGVTHDVGHLVVASVVHTLHRVKDTALHRFQAVLDMRHGTLQNNIRGIIQEPILIHTAQVMHHRSVETVHGLVIRVTL